MNNITKLSRSLLFLLCATGAAHADTFSVGAGALIEQTAYRDYDRHVYPMPVINYDSQYVFIKGASVGAYAINNDNQQLYINVAYLPGEFKTSRTDNSALKQLDNRKLSLMAGMGYSYKAEWGNIYTHVMTDISGNSKGTIADLAYGYGFRFEKLYIEPKIGVEWQNSKYNNYYFGIKQQEANRSGLAYYSANSGSTPYLAINMHYTFNENWQAFVLARYTRLSNAIKDSPMASRSSTGLMGTGVLYRF